MKIENFEKKIINLESDGIEKSTKQLLDEEIPPIDILGAMGRALEEVGERYEKGKYFVADLVIAGDIAKEVREVLEPHLEERYEEESEIRKIVIGTVTGDIHNIGKNIVTSLVRGAGHEIIDLGVDVPPSDFVESVVEEKPDVLGLSALLSHSIPEIGKVVEALKEKGIRDKVKIIIGGNPVRKRHVDEYGADAYAESATDVSRIIKELT